jgi:fibronectin type 3 domain-containing protein
MFNIENPNNVHIDKYVIYRQSSGEALKIITEINASSVIDNNYIYYDKNITKNKTYTYKITAYDNSGNILSESKLKTI